MEIRQLFDAETSTYSYLLWDAKTREAALIDSVDTQIERDLQLIKELGLDPPRKIAEAVPGNLACGLKQG